MYNEFKEDLKNQADKRIRHKIPLWGKAIKGLLAERKENGEESSVTYLAEKTGINDKHIFNILAGRVRDPSSEKLVKIADALGIPFPELTSRAMNESPDFFFVSSFGQRGIIQYPQHGFSIQSLSPPGTGSRDFFMGIMIISPFRELKKWKFSPHSMICIFLEAGTLEITYGNKTRKLHANESVYFDGGISHKLRNIDSIDARCILVTRPPLH
ncbi:MAG: hypothetical protein COV74_00755 [Candidatus Omnitrophica bacterium CG11_big_fil_rev_8_21_14_0_20_45_26]|uniref:HTH cro/C1-type domain-containing protein n=1 Tax=Candidatus Abzuiibacterium crystallinum TaxID=1974748 RepID=A0A2H0LVA7_9BACT|nr:MAG: hypothetical protein COV74_00755 [Candidatus Omnitrophica bacterium CG11_big_fil_rev_8_21_14_0_20_45_26]PIW64853.1 MAG: hypothetical protein COW12_04515 [Candidatus Omnitrophica bacterium CG12_big_fil_rev_8_21_14_0_65_45_16]